MAEMSKHGVTIKILTRAPYVKASATDATTTVLNVFAAATKTLTATAPKDVTVVTKALSLAALTELELVSTFDETKLLHRSS